MDGPTATVTPARYQQFICDSRGEISTAKNVYVALRTGWFSCRSACYLAAGRPVVVQDTGFRSIVPCGAGLLTFSTAEEAEAALELAEADYEGQCRAALDVARDHFDCKKVLGRLLEDVYS